MGSIEELKLVRLYRAYNTAIQMCMDRGYAVRHPSAVAHALRDPSVYSDEYGLDYDWFLQHFVVRQATATGAAEEDEGNASRVQASHDGAVEKEERGRWTPMRGAMRLVCSAETGKAMYDASGSPNKSGEKGGRSMLVFFSALPSLSMGELQEFREKALQKHAHCMIVVSAGKITPVVRRGARELSGRLRAGTAEEIMSIQLFEEDELAFNIARHDTVPSHVALSPEQAQDFLQRRQISLSQLPRILNEDPMVAYLGLVRGSIVKIQRDTKESGPYEMYRQVI
ncbi:DNA-directed RNA polymerase II [Trypanosoma conorhini]|uniref:DNA-directed RNA polymerase II n=1 Tax=Trypanosoma conorhini TaxID=83891 RepID=A0A3R7PWB1_9TRYP|nr:DNA-directed RNA polymerase II [Trypanosoma conorhini]RNF26150.1 DNA-directed RNA polymerase II [Trypanosoma conorhini]